MLAFRGTRHQQGRNIRAGDNQQERNSGVEKPQRFLHSTNDNGLERLQAHRQISIGLRELLAQLALHRGEIQLRPGNRNAGLESSHDGKPG
jgi:hypothetical protein